jgi:hypothetical protein
MTRLRGGKINAVVDGGDVDDTFVLAAHARARVTKNDAHNR